MLRSFFFFWVRIFLLISALKMRKRKEFDIFVFTFLLQLLVILGSKRCSCQWSWTSWMTMSNTQKCKREMFWMCVCVCAWMDGWRTIVIKIVYKIATTISSRAMSKSTIIYNVSNNNIIKWSFIRLSFEWREKHRIRRNYLVNAVNSSFSRSLQEQKGESPREKSWETPGERAEERGIEREGERVVERCAGWNEGEKRNNECGLNEWKRISSISSESNFQRVKRVNIFHCSVENIPPHSIAMVWYSTTNYSKCVWLVK